jgi:hypothetical protein
MDFSPCYTFRPQKQQINECCSYWCKRKVEWPWLMLRMWQRNWPGNFKPTQLWYKKETTPSNACENNAAKRNTNATALRIIIDSPSYMHNGFWIVNKTCHSSTQARLSHSIFESVLTVINKDVQLTTMAGMTPPQSSTLLWTTVMVSELAVWYGPGVTMKPCPSVWPPCCISLQIILGKSTLNYFNHTLLLLLMKQTL